VKHVIFLTSLFLFQSIHSVSSIASQKEKIKVIYESNFITNISIVRNKVDYIALRDIADMCSGQLFWHRVSKKAEVKINNQSMFFFYGSKKAYLNNKKISLEYSTLFISNRIYIPFSFLFTEDFSKASGLEVSYDKDELILTFEKRVNVLEPRIYNGPDLTKIKLELTETLAYELEKTGEKEYLITFYRGKTISSRVDFDDGPVRSVSMENDSTKATCRIIIAEENLEIEHKLEKNQLSIFIHSEKEGEYEEEIVEDTGTEISPAVIPSTVISTGAVSGKFNIVIDPGHGGEDPGCIGYNGTKEKVLTLKISEGLAKLLREDGHEVFLTRTDDTFIPLVERTNFANKKNADIFISIHCNSSLKKTSEGFEIYFLSEKASDPEAEATAALENSVIKIEGKPTKKQKTLQELLWSMVVNEFINDSSELCSFITEGVIKRTMVENRGIKQAGFYVLRGAQMPAVLVECGFLSNPKEEAKLRSKTFQNKVIDGIYSGIKEYETWKTSK